VRRLDEQAGRGENGEVTVKVHRHNLMKKLDARSFAELVRKADALRIRGGNDSA